MTTDAYADERLAMLAALVNGDVSLANRLAHEMLAGGVPFAAITADVLTPVQSELGTRWAAGDLGIAFERASSAAVEELFVRLGATAEPPTGPTVVVATPELDEHSLGARAVASSLTLEGFRVVYLGASVPAEDLADCLDVQDPLALALSCSLPTALVGAAHSTAAAHALGIPVVAGGRGLAHAARARAVGVDAYVKLPNDAIAVLRGWEAAPPASLSPAPADVPERAAFAHGAAAVAAALDRSSVPVERRERLADELARVLRVIESALLVGEPGLVVEHIAWLRATGEAHGFARGAIDAALAALADRMHTSAPRAAAVLRDATA